MRRQQLSRAGRRLSLVAALVLAFGLAIGGPGTVATWGSGVNPAGTPPSWAQPCLHRAPRGDRILLARCARASGRVLWVRKRRGELHFALVARFHLFVVKGESAPAIGDTKLVIGPLVRARNGLREIEAFALRDP